MRLHLALAAVACLLGCQEPEVAEPARLATRQAAGASAAPVPTVEALNEAIIALRPPTVLHLGVELRHPDAARLERLRTLTARAPFA